MADLRSQLDRIEAKLDELLGERREASDVSIDLCLSADDPRAALKERNKKIMQRRRQQSRGGK